MSPIQELPFGTEHLRGRATPSGLADRVRRALRATGHVHCLDVDVREIEGQVVLRGRVPSYYAWQVAQCAACAAVGPARVCNELDVGLRSAASETAEPSGPS